MTDPEEGTDATPPGTVSTEDEVLATGPPESEWVEPSPSEEGAELDAGDEEEKAAGPLFGGDSGAAISRPPWLVQGPPKTNKQRWPGGARSASWLKRLRKCPRNHSQRYRHRRPDPTGWHGRVGNVVHDVLDWGAKRRLMKRFRGQSSTMSVEEMLHLAEFHATARREASVLERAREILTGLGSVDFSKVYASEMLVHWYASHSFHLAGYIDLVEVEGEPRRPHEVTGEVVATDYKTGSTILTDEQMFRDEQVGLYLTGIRRLFPNASRITFRMWYVAEGLQKEIPYSRYLEREFLARARSRRITWLSRDETADPSAGNCGHCPYRGTCVALSTAISRSTALPPAGSVEAWPLPEKMRRYREAKVAEKNAAVRAGDLAPLILKELGPKQSSYRAGRLLASKVRKTVTHWDSPGKALVEIAQAVDIPLASIIDQLGKGIGDRKIKSWVASLGAGYRESVEAIIDKRQKTTGGAARIQVTESESVGTGKTKVRLPF